MKILFRKKEIEYDRGHVCFETEYIKDENHFELRDVVEHALFGEVTKTRLYVEEDRGNEYMWRDYHTLVEKRPDKNITLMFINVGEVD